MATSKIVKVLAHIAAKEIQNIRSTSRMPPQISESYRLAEVAFGSSKIQEDFAAWLQELKALGIVPTYPVSEYLKVIESRLKDRTLVGTGGVERVQFGDVIPKKITTEEEAHNQELMKTGRVTTQDLVEERLKQIAQDKVDIANTDPNQC